VASDTIATMQPPHRPPARSATALLACALIGFPLAGCGGSSSSGRGTDPALAVPASAAIYAGAVVRPAGALKARARAAGQTLTHQADPYLRLLGLLQTPGSPALDFKRNLAPWLGAQAGIFLSSSATGGRADLGPLLSPLRQGLLGGSTGATFPFGGGAARAGTSQGAIVLDTTDAGKARSFLSAQAARAGAHAASYRGVAYQATGGGLGFGLVDRLAVIGTESALRSVIDTTRGGASLARAPAYARLLSAGPAQALAHVYLSGAAAAAEASPRAGASPGLLALLTGGRPANVSLLPSASSIALDADTLPAAAPGAPGGLLSPTGEPARAAGELPGESFVAIGFGSAHSALSQYAQALPSLASLPGTPTRPGGEAQGPGLSIKGLLAATLAPVRAMTEDSAEARRNFQSWMGPGAVFASGSGLLDLKAAAVISSRNPALSRAAVAKLAVKLRSSGASVQPASIPGTDAALSAKLTGLPVTLDIADGRDAKGQTKFVIGLGEASVAAALNPSSTLSATSYGGAGAVLGEGIQPALIVQVPTLLALLESAGLSEDPTVAPVLPYLRLLSSVVGGSRSLGGGVERFRVVLELRPS
jgi:hypothetical protein